ALAAEVVAIGCREGVKVGSRIDPLAITSGATIYPHKGNPNEWTPDLDEALHDAKGKPVLFGKSASGDRKGRPAGINHGNIAPSVDEWSGGITADYALQTVVFSLAALRRLQFRTAPDGSPLNDPVATSAAARTALAALGRAGLDAPRLAGVHHRAPARLHPHAAAPIEIVTGDGAATADALETAQATALVREAADRAAAAGLAWSREPLKLVPTPKLVALIQKSRDLQAVHGDTEEG
ncbi:MAG: type I-U CRISPR-associated protein Cas7, partial [Gemmatimonadota bacterium]